MGILGYIVSSLSGTLYIGVTNDINKRVKEHKKGQIEGFSKKYRCTRLVYYESFDDVRQAISREKQLKGWQGQEGCTYFLARVAERKLPGAINTEAFSGSFDSCSARMLASRFAQDDTG